jgi:hypothetical protein
LKMNGIRHFDRDAVALEHEIFKLGIFLGIDWEDHVAVRALAREALNRDKARSHAALHNSDRKHRATAELFALSELMLRTMTESAQVGIHTQGGPTWKALGRALFEESELLKPNPFDPPA